MDHYSVDSSLLRSADIILGALALDQIEDSRSWLHDGAVKAIFQIPSSMSNEVRNDNINKDIDVFAFL